MKNSNKIRCCVLLIAALSAGSRMSAQQASCCSKPVNSSDAFAMLGKNEQFLAAHESPLPFTFVSEKGKMITYKTNDTVASAFEIKSEKPSNKYLLVVHEWWGLNDYIKQEAENLQKELGDVNVIAIDLYDGKVAANAADAGKYMGMLKSERAVAILNGAITYAGKDAKIYTIGWCFGGGWSLQASILAGKQGAGCVMYYGMPEKDMAKLKTLNCDVLGIFAGKDQWINKDVVSTFEKDMKTAGKKLTVVTYDADHAFANPSNPHYNKEYSEAAHKLAVAFIKEHLK